MMENKIYCLIVCLMGNAIIKQIWRLWAKALGEKTGDTDRESDRIACIRTIIVLSYIITNCFIMAGVIRHWNQ